MATFSKLNLSEESKYLKFERFKLPRPKWVQNWMSRAQDRRWEEEESLSQIEDQLMRVSHLSKEHISGILNDIRSQYKKTWNYRIQSVFLAIFKRQ